MSYHYITMFYFKPPQISGKTLETKEPSRLLVPHRFFTHFYITGYLFNTLFLLDLIFQTTFISFTISSAEDLLQTILTPLGIGQFEKFKFSATQPWLPSLLLHAQLTRRLLESLVIVKHDRSKMHAAHLLFALCYYPLLSLSINISSVLVYTPLALLSVVVFCWASLHQYRCHVILAELRESGDNVYGIPYGDWFVFVSSPHYLAEILIYISIFVSSGAGYLLGANCLYQILNFSLICTPPTHNWYLKKFEDYPRNRKILVPFVY